MYLLVVDSHSSVVIIDYDTIRKIIAYKYITESSSSLNPHSTAKVTPYTSSCLRLVSQHIICDHTDLWCPDGGGPRGVGGGGHGAGAGARAAEVGAVRHHGHGGLPAAPAQDHRRVARLPPARPQEHHAHGTLLQEGRNHIINMFYFLTATTRVWTSSLCFNCKPIAISIHG